MNKYQTDEPPTANLFKIDPEAEAIAIKRVEELRANRDHGRWERALASFGQAAEALATKDYSELDGSLIEAAIEAARADATTGEMMGALKSALGWRAPHEY